MRRTSRPDPRVAVLAAIPLFHGLRPKQLRQVAGMMSELVVSEGTELCRQGHRGRETFLLIDGEARVLVDGVEVATLTNGALIGELSLIDDAPRTATVVTTTRARVLVCNAGEFAALRRFDPFDEAVSAVADARRTPVPAPAV